MSRRNPSARPKAISARIAAKPCVKSMPADRLAREHDDIRLGFLIHNVSRMRRTAYDQLMKPLGVTRAQWWVLAHLSRHDGMMQTELAAALDVGKASLGSLIERLCAAGFVERSEAPGDRRAKRVHLAEPGNLLVQQMAQAEISLNKRILGDLSFAERGAMIRTLSTIKQALSRQLSASAGDS